MNEKFLREIGLEPAQSTSRNPLEKPPARNPEFIPSYRRAREETLSLTEEEIRMVEGK